jgi:hypothetical protein
MAKIRMAFLASRAYHARMTDEVRKMLNAVPFLPFLVKTSDGRQYRVKHPDYVAISPKGGRIVVFADEEASTTLSALHIVAVEPQLRRATSHK